MISQTGPTFDVRILHLADFPVGEMVHHLFTVLAHRIPLPRMSGDMARSRPTTWGSVSRTASMSLSFVYRPRLNRSEPWESSCGRPMASRTCDGLETRGRAGRTGRTGDPQHVQAQDHPLPFDISTERLMLFGSRRVGWPFRRIPSSRSKMPRMKRSRSAVSLAASSVKRRRGQLHRLPETDDSGDVLRGGPAAALLLAAVHEAA